MPNWCEGSLKLRGKYEDILKFWEEGVNAYSHSADQNNECGTDLIPKTEWYEIEEWGDGGATINNHIPSYAWIYIENTKRAFVLDDFCAYDIHKLENGMAIMALPFKQAWSIRQDDWIEIAKKYHLEIKIWAIESGMGFWCTFHVLSDGVIIENNFHQSDDYNEFVWNCPLPWMGG